MSEITVVAQALLVALATGSGWAVLGWAKKNAPYFAAKKAKGVTTPAPYAWNWLKLRDTLIVAGALWLLVAALGLSQDLSAQLVDVYLLPNIPLLVVVVNQSVNGLRKWWKERKVSVPPPVDPGG